MHQHRQQAGLPQAQPQQGQGQERNGGQRVEHAGQGGQHIAAPLARYRQHRQQQGPGDPQQIALQQDAQRYRRLAQQRAIAQLAQQGGCRLAKGGQQQVVILPARCQLPGQRQQRQDEGLAQCRVLQQPPGQRQAPHRQLRGRIGQRVFRLGPDGRQGLGIARPCRKGVDAIVGLFSGIRPRDASRWLRCCWCHRRSARRPALHRTAAGGCAGARPRTRRCRRWPGQRHGC